MRIYKRKQMWYCDYAAHGQRVRKPLSENERIAQRMADDLDQAHRMGKLGLPSKDFTINAFKERYFEWSHSEKALNSWRRDQQAFHELEETFPTLRYLHEITPELLERLKIKWKGQGMGTALSSRLLQSLKSAMRTAERWKYVQPQDWSIVKVPKVKGRLLYYTVEEYAALLAKCDGDWQTAARLMGRAGLRSGEVRHLRWQDIHFDRRAIHIIEKPCDLCFECRHKGNIWRPKGWKSPENNKERWVDMPKDLEAYLKALPKRQDWILGPDARHANVYEVYFRQLIKNAGLKGSPHTLRHTYASHLVSNGVSLEVVGELLGHTDPATTKIYAHLMPHARRDAVERLPELVPSCATFVPRSASCKVNHHPVKESNPRRKTVKK